jgi:hypothetical protein
VTRTAAALAVVLGSFSIASLGFSQPNEPVSMDGGRIRMTLPGGWIEIPPAHLEDLTFWAADATAGRIVEVYQHGYRPRDWREDPGLPQILVQIRRDGRQDLRPYLRLPAIESVREGAREAFGQGVPPLVMGVEVERVWFDRDRVALRLENALDLRFRGRVRVLSAAFLTEEGFVVVHYADRERRIDAGRTVFQTVVDSLELESGLAYHPRLMERFPGLPFFVAAGLVLIVLFVYLKLRGHRRT